MSSSARYRKRTTKICIGDMDILIDIFHRDLSAPKDVKFGLPLKKIREQVWCSWEVRDGGVELFDGVNQQVASATDIVTLHYDKDFREFDIILLNGIYYEVLLADWLDPRSKEFIVLYCVQKGKKEKKVNIL